MDHLTWINLCLFLLILALFSFASIIIEVLHTASVHASSAGCVHLRLVDFSLPITLSLRASLICPKTLFWYSYPILMLAPLILVSLACPYSPVDTSHGLYCSGLWHHQWKPSTTTYRCGIQWSIIYISRMMPIHSTLLSLFSFFPRIFKQLFLALFETLSDKFNFCTFSD